MNCSRNPKTLPEAVKTKKVNNVRSAKNLLGVSAYLLVTSMYRKLIIINASKDANNTSPVDIKIARYQWVPTQMHLLNGSSFIMTSKVSNRKVPFYKAIMPYSRHKIFIYTTGALSNILKIENKKIYVCRKSGSPAKGG